MELFDLERKIKNNIEGSKIKQNLLEGFLNELQKIGDGKGKNSFGDRDFLTRLSDKAQMQEFDISNKLYNELLNCKNEELKVVFHNGDYKIIT